MCPRCKIIITARSHGLKLSVDDERRLADSLVQSLAKHPSFRWAVVKQIGLWILLTALTITGGSVFSIFEIRKAARDAVNEEKAAIRKQIAAQFEEERFRRIVHDVAMERAGAILTNAIQPTIDAFKTEVGRNIGSVEAETGKIRKLTLDLESKNNFQSTLLSALCDDFDSLVQLRRIANESSNSFQQAASAAFFSVQRLTESPELVEVLKPEFDPSKSGVWAVLRKMSLLRLSIGKEVVEGVASGNFTDVEKLFFFRYVVTSAMNSRPRFFAMLHLAQMKAEQEKQKFEGFNLWKAKTVTDWARARILETNDQTKLLSPFIANPGLVVPSDLMPLLMREPATDDSGN